MPLMYFSGYDRNEITIDEPSRRRMMVNPKIFASVQNDEKRNTRLFLDTHLLLIRNYGTVGSLRKSWRPKSGASIFMGTLPDSLALVYISEALTNA